MKPPPLPARRPAPPVPATDDRESLWHVAIAPDDIKVLTLEKLDDLFRLDVIDETTKIWRPGMAAWQPLGVVAGIEPTPPEPAQVQSPPSPARRGAPPPTRPPVPPRRNMDSDHPTPVASNLSSTMPLGAPMSLGDTMPLDALDSSPNLVTRTEVQAPPAAMLAASRPTAPPWAPELRERALMNELPDLAPRARETGRVQRLTLALSVVAGLLVTLYRNDVLLDAARSAGHQGVYLQIETALGGPGFGTPRSLEKLGVSAEPAATK
ncbi:DUF4339 domain-containing protein [Sorangium sp. So ce1000]|uniref:DUF4339 domain-containing protein n=1 Tax=Sorangium sp. So ce1000 TaxID=3133325 RepID=UPI003F6067E7